MFALSNFLPIPISIHAPREGGDGSVFEGTAIYNQLFQSTPPARGATLRDPSDFC